MPVTLRLPTPLRKHADGAKSVEVRANTVRQALTEVVHKYPDMKPSLFDAEGRLNRFVRVFVNEHDIADLDGTATPLGERDTLSLVCPIAGG